VLGAGHPWPALWNIILAIKMNWEKTKKRIIRDLTEPIKSADKFPYKIDLSDCLDYLKVVLEYEIDDNKISGLADSVFNSINEYFSGSHEHSDRLNILRILVTNYESFLKKIIYIIDKEYYWKISDSKQTGLIPLIKKLNLNRENIFFSEEKISELIGKPYFIEHICRTYILRNEFSHHSPELSTQQIAESINSILIAYLVAIFESDEQLLNSLPSINKFVNEKKQIFQNRIFPDWEEIKSFNQPLTDGELFLLEYLDNNLPRQNEKINLNDIENCDSWLIFVQPYLNGTRPDIILLNPKVGIQIIEVKDWNIEHYNLNKIQKSNKKNEYVLYVNDGSGQHPIKRPDLQVAYYKKKIVEQLLPQIGERIDVDSSAWGTIKTSLYFHNETTAKINNFFSCLKIHKKNPIFGFDSLDKNNLSEIVPDVQFRFSKYWKSNWTKEILYWLIPPHHSLNRDYKEIKLTDKQRQISENITGHMRIRGVAGSGKTFLLAYCAALLSKQQHNVLIISYNITLWHYIRHMMSKLPLSFSWSNITFNHFHGFCNDILNQYGEKWDFSGDEEDIFRNKITSKTLQILKKNNFEFFNKFDAILIDEGQDYYFEWYSFLTEILTSSNKLVVVCDKKQNIYNRNLSWLDKRKGGLDQFGDWIDLLSTMRLHPNLTNFINDFIDYYDLEEEKRKEIKIKSTAPILNEEDSHIIWKNSNESNWINETVHYFKILKNNNINPSDVVVLLPNKNYGLKCVSAFKKLFNIECNHVFEEEDEEKRIHKHKKAFWPGDSRLKISTPHSFKGWESANVIVFIPENFKSSEFENDRLLYTSFTRAKINLIVINSNERYIKFGEKYSTEWVNKSLF